MSSKVRFTIMILLAICAAVFIYIGVKGGEPLMVMKKAVNVCLECIGLGK